MKVIINETQERLLFEFFSDMVYHYTDEDGMKFICEKNKIPLTEHDKYYTSGQQNDEMLSNGFPYYLSFTRSRNSSVGYGSWRYVSSLLTVRIQFNGSILNNNFKGKPVDYFKSKATTNDFRLVQSEDRLFSKKKFIDNAYKYIDRIDVLLNDSSDMSNLEWFDKFIKEMKNTLFSEKIVVYFNKNDFDFQKSIK